MANSIPTSMAAAAQQYREASYLYQPRGQSSTDTGPPAMAAPESTDAVMTDVQQEQQSSSAVPASVAQNVQQSTQPSQPRTPTPVRTTNTAPVPAPEAAPAVPLQPVEHGAPFRRYLNSKVTPTLLAGMKQLALEQPNDPLRYLGEYLLRKSRELEGQ